MSVVKGKKPGETKKITAMIGRRNYTGKRRKTGMDMVMEQETGGRRSAIQHLIVGLLRLMAFQFNHRKLVRDLMRSDAGWINFTIGARTESGSVGAGIRFREGKVTVIGSLPPDADMTLIFASDKTLLEMLWITPNEVLNRLMINKIRTEGNFTYLCLFNYYLSVLLDGVHRRLEKKRQGREAKRRLKIGRNGGNGAARRRPSPARLHAGSIDPGVKHLPDPYLPDLSLADFPRLERFLEIHFTQKPELCCERPRLVTNWHKLNGFETDANGNPWIPEIRQARVFKHLMENRRPIIRTGDLLAGTTTSKEIGVVIYPDAGGTMIWGELRSVPQRELNPYDVSEETINVLHREVFPYWAHRNFREWVREKHGNPLCQQIDERFAVYFIWNSIALSHTIPDYPKLLALGTRGIVAEIDRELKKRTNGDLDKRNALKAMKISLEGLVAYTRNLSVQAARDAAAEADPVRRAELERLAGICARVPEKPARTLDEAVNAVWIAWIGLHMENTNAGLSLGRLDTWLQPYFEADMTALETNAERAAYIRHAVELVGCLFMRCTDHLPLAPDIGNYLFGGSSSDQAITLGGVTPGGTDAVCDMTYIFLKVTEILGIRDPNVNARYDPDVNSETYLTRLCEVNLIANATPSMHNDQAVLASLADLGYKPEHARDWAATGCVEPTVSGRHMGHTNSMMMSLVAALEMALHNGRHPLMNWKVGPDTGSVVDGAFGDFESFFNAFAKQLSFLIQNATRYSNILGEAHAELRPTPFLSSLIDGTIASGRDVTKGGARYNSSGVACIGLVDVTDSLMAIKKLVYDERWVTFSELKAAVDADFAGYEKLHAMVRNKVPLFGSGDLEARAMADRVAALVHGLCAAQTNERGGPYTTGFWSMSNHVAFGNLAGALPSGRLAGKAFTPGLTPGPNASPNLLDNLRDVAGLDPKSMDNNMAFNVKVVPATTDTHAQIVDTIRSYVQSYFDLGGMQMQMNVVSSETLRDAMVHPDAYRNLLVRISGYNAYFVTLNSEMQVELIERSEYRIG